MRDKHAECLRIDCPVQNAFPVRDQISQVGGEVDADHVLEQSPLPIHVHCSPERAGGPIAGNEVVAGDAFGFGSFEQGANVSPSNRTEKQAMPCSKDPKPNASPATTSLPAMGPPARSGEQWTWIGR